MSLPTARDSKQICAISRLCQRLREPRELLGIYVTRTEHNFLRATYLEPLSGLDGLNKRGGLEQRLVSAGIQPCDASPEEFYLQSAPRQVSTIDVGNLELAPGRRRQRGGDINNRVVI